MISIIIPTYKKNLCLQNLKKNIPYFKEYEIIIVNDNPETKMKQDIQHFKNVHLIENHINSGFGVSINKGVTQAKNPYIMLLNDDVVLKDTSYENSLNYFKKDHNLFAVSFAQIEKNGTIVGKNKVYWKKGFIHHTKQNDLKSGCNAWAEGGACLIDKSKFNAVGGFDKRYSPFYWEDVDLSYQAYRHGFYIMFDSSIQLIHHHESTIGQIFDKKFVQSIAFRNQLLFIWKNIDDFILLYEHVLYLISAIIKGRVFFIKGFLQALPYIPSILAWKIKQSNLKQVINRKKRTLP